MTVKDAIEEFLLYAQDVRGLSENTIAAYRNDLIHFVQLLSCPRACNADDNTGGMDIAQITAEDVLQTMGQLSRNKMSAVSINRYISAVRTLFAYCRQCGYVEVNVTSEIRTLKTPKHLAKFLTNPETDDLCAQPEKHELLWEKRDKAIFEMLYSSGCRVSELISMRLCDMENDASSAIIKGKGKKERRIFFESDAQIAFRAYMADRKRFFAEHGKIDDVPEVFINQRCKPLTRRGVYIIVSRYSGAEGINHHISPHTMRHTFATAMVTAGCDVRIVQELLGHKSISTTQRYTHVTTEQLIALYNKTHPHCKR